MGTFTDHRIVRRFLATLHRRSLHFIVGVPRSGTTLCRMLLGSHPRILAPSETPWIFGAYGDDVSISLANLVRMLRTSRYGPANSIAGIVPGDVHLAASRFLLAIFESKMSVEGRDSLILKTPDDIVFVDEILETYKQSLVIHIRRDVRDVALSTTRTDWENLNLFGKNNFENSVRRWVAWEGRIEAARARAPDRIVTVRYEDLVLDPKGTLERIVQKLGISFDRNMLNYRDHARGVPEWDTGSLDALGFDKIEPTRAFAYRLSEPDDEQRKIIAEYADDIAKLGYQPGWFE